jgi:hypothetical protein
MRSVPPRTDERNEIRKSAGISERGSRSGLAPDASLAAPGRPGAALPGAATNCAAPSGFADAGLEADDSRWTLVTPGSAMLVLRRLFELGDRGD